jgi:hypothetical protein
MAINYVDIGISSEVIQHIGNCARQKAIVTVEIRHDVSGYTLKPQIDGMGLASVGPAVRRDARPKRIQYFRGRVV